MAAPPLRPGESAIARPILRLATRLNRRTRLTAWAIAFACMVLVGSLSLVDGMSAGVNSVASRFQLGPAVYLHGDDLVASAIDPALLASLPGNYSVLRVHIGTLSISGVSLQVVVASLEAHAGPSVTVPFPANASAIALDAGLVRQIADTSGRTPGSTANLTLFGRTVSGLPVAPPPSSRPTLFPDTWAWVTPAFLAGLDATRGPEVQALLTASPLEPALAARLGLTPLATVGAIRFVQGSVAEAGADLKALSFVLAIVIALLVLSVMGLEVRQREAELRTLRSLGAAPRTVVAFVGGRAVFLAMLGATLGSALGIVVAHAVVSFAPLVGLPSLILLSPPYLAVAWAYATALGGSLLGAVVPVHRAVVLSRRAREAIPS